MAFSRASARPSVLISGAGIAGPTLAYWLLRAGMAPVIVESAPAPRTGGYLIDFWGAGYDVAAQMGLTARLHKVGYRIETLKLVDAESRTIASVGVGALGDALGDRYVSLPRGDLAAALLECVEADVEISFGDEVTRLDETGGGVEATFRHAPQRCFDLVVGADGLHSNIRRLCFDDPDAVKPLGYLVGAFTADGYPHADPSAYVSRTQPGRQIVRFSLADRRTAFFAFVAAELGEGRALDTSDRQRAFLAEAFADIGSEASDIGAAIAQAADLYFDTVAQVRLPAWSKGRVALVGDAAYGPSLLAGEGASLAMTGAFVLAGELSAARPDFAAAFGGYEARLRKFMQDKQRGALRMGGWFAPRTSLGLFVRNQLTRLAGLPGLSGLIVGSAVRDRYTLPRFDWSAPAG